MAVFKGQGKITKTKRTYINMMFSILLCYVLFVGFLFLNQRSFIYHPQNTKPDLSASGLERAEVIAVQPEDMKESIEGWYIAPVDNTRPVILYFHGNGLNIDARAPRVEPWVKEGYGVLLAEYRGYGLNAGKPSEKGFRADAKAYMEWLTVRENIPSNRIVVYGESIGSGTAVWLASQKWNILGLILEAPFTSLTDIARKRFFFAPVDLLLLDRFDNKTKIKNISAPLLIIHGEKDAVVPVEYGRRLFDAANNPKELKLFPDAGHNDLHKNGARQAILDFLAKLGKE